jgi:hypothetical protein
VGGPASLFARWSIAPTERNYIAPLASAANRITGSPRVVTHVIDGGLDIALTGRKSWRGLVPTVGGGVGIVSDFATSDSGSYQFGTKFALSYGFGVQYVMRSGVRLRADATNFLWQYSYPDTYFARAVDSTFVLTDTRQRTAWRGNWGLLFGVVLPIFR